MGFGAIGAFWGLNGEKVMLGRIGGLLKLPCLLGHQVVTIAAAQAARATQATEAFYPIQVAFPNSTWPPPNCQSSHGTAMASLAT